MKILKWFFGFIALVLLVTGASAFFFISKGGDRATQTYSMGFDDAFIRSDEEALELGEYLTQTHGCDSCHGVDLGGREIIDAPPFLITATNLTAGEGGIGAEYSDADWLRAIRHGVGADGRGLMIMPSEAYYFFSDEEVGALIGYLQQLDPVDNVLPAVTFRPLGKLIMGASDQLKTSAEMIPNIRRLETRPRGETAEWGEYRTSVMCAVCHGRDLKGAPPTNPESPLAPDLRAVASWGVDGFLRAMRKGVVPGGREMDTEFMPWDEFGKMDDTDLRAIYEYLRTVD